MSALYPNRPQNRRAAFSVLILSLLDFRNACIFGANSITGGLLITGGGYRAVLAMQMDNAVDTQSNVGNFAGIQGSSVGNTDNAMGIQSSAGNAGNINIGNAMDIQSSVGTGNSNTMDIQSSVGNVQCCGHTEQCWQY